MDIAPLAVFVPCVRVHRLLHVPSVGHGRATRLHHHMVLFSETLVVCLSAEDHIFPSLACDAGTHILLAVR
jgi:hypothetical protein